MATFQLGSHTLLQRRRTKWRSPDPFTLSRKCNHWMLVCGPSYWPVVFELQQRMEIHSCPPGGVEYRLCWLLSLGVVDVKLIPLALA